MEKKSWPENQALGALGFLHLDLVLEEIFGVYPKEFSSEKKRPETVGELAAYSKSSLHEVSRKLREILAMENAIEIDAEELRELLRKDNNYNPPILIDVRERWEFDIARLEGSILLVEANFPSLLPVLQKAPKVITICHHGVRSYSAAMYLKSKGVHGVQSLAGGLDHWAQVIDPHMPRY